MSISSAAMNGETDHHHGTLVRKVEVGDLVLSRTVYPPQLHLTRHVHRQPFFSLVLRGGFTEIGDSSSFDCRPSSLIFRAGDQAHSNQFHDAGAECVRVELGPFLDRYGRDRLDPLRSAAFQAGGPASWLALRLADELSYVDDCSPLVIEGLVLETLGMLARTSQATGPRPPTWLAAARDLLEEKFDEPFDARALASAVGVHPVHLSRSFRTAFGCTMGDYLRRTRIEHACVELRRGEVVLADLALAVGFSSQSHFSAAFKRLLGKTPAQYRAAFGPVRRRRA